MLFLFIVQALALSQLNIYNDLSLKPKSGFEKWIEIDMKESQLRNNSKKKVNFVS